MNILRSIFISAFSGYIALAFFYALFQLVRGMEPFFSWLGLALSAGSPLAFLAWLYLSGAARKSRHPVPVSSQPLSHSRKLAQKHEAPMQFMRDPGNSAAKQLGIAHHFGTPMGLQALGYGNDTAMPTVIITDPDGTILFADETDNYRIRPEPELFLEIIRGQ